MDPGLNFPSHKYNPSLGEPSMPLLSLGSRHPCGARTYTEDPNMHSNKMNITNNLVGHRYPQPLPSDVSFFETSF